MNRQSRKAVLTSSWRKRMAGVALLTAMVTSPLGALAQTNKGYVGDAELRIPECKITAPPKELHLDKFYKKYVDVNGIPIVTSWRVPDSCIVAAHHTLYAMTCMLKPEVLEAMKKHGTRVAIMARYEGETDIPEHHFMINDTTVNMDVRARGMEGTMAVPVTTCAEENILAYQIDKYHAEDILIHEFAHSIHLIGIYQVDPTINDKLDRLFAKAKARGIYANTYRLDNSMEYFAEAVQDWFNVNAEVQRADGKHNWINTREELRAMDPEMYAFLSQYFPATTLQISKHKKQNLYTCDYADLQRAKNFTFTGQKQKVEEGYMPFKGYQVYYRIVGERQEGKAPIILLHGGPGSTHNYFEVLDQIAETGHQVIMYDQLGCGKSYVEGHPELWKTETWVDELDALRQYLHLDQVHLLGQSWGGMLALAYVYERHPEGVRSLILSSTNPSASMWVQEQHRLVKYLPEKEQKAIAKAEATGDFDSKAYKSAIAHYMEQHCAAPVTADSPECLRREKKAGTLSYIYGWGPNELNATGDLKDFEYLEKMKSIDLPTLVISGSDDLCTPAIAKAMNDALPNSKWELFVGSRHMPFVEDHEHYCKVLAEWLMTHL